MLQKNIKTDILKPNTLRLCIMIGTLLLNATYISGMHFASRTRNQMLFWPLWNGTDNNGGYIYLAEPFGPRNNVKPEDKYSNGTGNWFHTGLDIGATGSVKNPYMGEGEHGGKAYVYDFGGVNADAMWVVVRQSDGVHEVKQTVYWHVVTDNVQKNQTTIEGGTFPFQVKSPNITYGTHLHFECYTDGTISNLENHQIRNIYSKDPLYWLWYDFSGYYDEQNNLLFHDLETNTYLAPNSSGKLSPVTNPNPINYKRIIEFDIGSDQGRDHVMIRVMQNKPGIDISRIEILPANQDPAIYFEGGHFFDLNNRVRYEIPGGTNANLLYDLNDPSANNMNNVWYRGNRIISSYWHSGVANEKKEVEFYVRANSAISPQQKFSIKIMDLYGNGFIRSDLGISSCVGCNPSTSAPPPPTSLSATQTATGIHLEWSEVIMEALEVGYRLYRRPANTPGIAYSEPIAYLIGTTTYNDLLSAAANGGKVLPGVQYAYSIAAMTTFGEGCNGPFASPCDWQENGCSSCSVDEAFAQMPNVSSFTFKNQIVGGDLGTVQANGTLTVQDVEVRSGSTVTLKGAPVNIYSKTIFEEGTEVTIQSP